MWAGGRCTDCSSELVKSKLAYADQPLVLAAHCGPQLPRLGKPAHKHSVSHALIEPCFGDLLVTRVLESCPTELCTTGPRIAWACICYSCGEDGLPVGDQ